MRTSLSPIPTLLLTVFSAALAGCGGGDSAVDANLSSNLLAGTSPPPAVSTTLSSTISGPATMTAPTTNTTTAAVPAPVPPPNPFFVLSAKTVAYIPQSRGTPTPTTTTTGSVTSVQLTSTATAARTNSPATFGQVFGQGDVRNGDTLVGLTDAGVKVPLQVDVKTRHADGSVRHAIITAQLPNAAPNQAQTVNLMRSAAAPASALTGPSALLNAGFTASMNASIAGVRYTASADALLKSGKYTTWLSGPLVNEWLVSAPLKTAAGVEHPHLTAQFAIRSYTGSNSARVDVTVENGWAYEAAPQNATYDAQILVGGQATYAKAGLTHYHHARWRKVFWWGNDPKINVRHNAAYLIASKALPNLDQSLVIKETTIASWKAKWDNGNTDPMEAGLGQPYMPATGARSDIGLMPAWNALYLLSMDERMKNMALGMSDLAGSWSTHFRNKSTGRPVSLADFPYISERAPAGDTKNPVTKQIEALPACPITVCATPMSADTSHQAAFAYIPYLVTGDYYHLEELQFWANWSSFYNNPAYRQGAKGIVKSDQVRGQAWTLRTLAEAAYITPDNDPQKENFTAIVNHNIDWYDANYTDNATANKLGVLEHGYAIVYDASTGLAPWQDDFFTASIGRMVELGFTRAQPLLTWKSKFVVNRMVGAGYCWVQAPAYSLKVRDSATAPLYTTIGQVYQANFSPLFTQLACASQAMASSLKLREGDMVGYVTPVSSQAIMGPALAYSSAVHPEGRQAWSTYVNRPYKPDYALEPQFAVLPR